MPSLKIDSLELRYRERGRGRPPLLLLHGAGASSLCFGELLNHLARQRRVVALDLPGHGGSAPLPQQPRIDRLLASYRDVAAELAERLGLGRFVLVGHSMGGAVAQRFALRYADRLAGLALLASGARLRLGRMLRDVLERRFDQLEAFLADTAFSPCTPRQAAERWAPLQLQARPRVVIADFDACDRFDVRVELPRLQPRWRTVVIGGGDDLITPPTLQRELAALVPRASLELVSRAGHQLILERPDVVAERILAATST